MRSKGSAEVLTQQIGGFRDRAADLIATDSGTRDSSDWPGRLLWFGLGMAIGAAAAGGRLLNALPTQLASRVDDLATKVDSATTELTEKVGSLGGDASEPVEEASSLSYKTIDVTEPTPEAIPGSAGGVYPVGVVGSR